MVKKAIKEYILITFGAVVAAAAIYFFMLPSHVAVGSGSALAMVLANFIPLPVSVISLSLNIIFLIMGFILIGPEFGVKTVYTTILVPVSLGVFEIFFPNFQSLTDDPLLDMVCYLIIVGIAMAILFSNNASSGGLDIVAKIMNKYLKMELGTAISVSGLAVALTTIFAYDTKIVVLSLLGTYMSGIVVDKFIFGLNIKRRVCILSQEHTQTIIDYLLHELHSGATLYESFGAYDGTARTEIVTIVDKNEYRKLMEFVKKTDPKAFVTVYSVNELRYQPKVKNK
jgi:uncharacterized membrane-anchored protein YitT (DUF2179 family)